MAPFPIGLHTLVFEQGVIFRYLPQSKQSTMETTQERHKRTKVCVVCSLEDLPA